MTEICQLKCQSVNKFDTGMQDIVLSPVINTQEHVQCEPLSTGGCQISWLNPTFVFVPGQVYSLQIAVIKA